MSLRHTNLIGWVIIQENEVARNLVFSSQTVFYPKLSLAKEVPNSKRYGLVSSLWLQGFIQGRGWVAEHHWRVPIPLHSGLHSKLYVEGWGMETRSQSLRDQGFIRTVADEMGAMCTSSQSLRDQGFIRTLATSRTFSQRTSAGVFPIFVWRRRLDSKL